MVTLRCIHTLLLLSSVLSHAGEPGEQAPNPIRVVFENVTFVNLGPVPTNTRIVTWRDGLTAWAAVVAAGGYSTPPTRRGKIIRAGTDIPFDLKRMNDWREQTTRLALPSPNPALQPGDIVYLY